MGHDAELSFWVDLHAFAPQGRVMVSIAQRLVTLCATLGEYPHIRFAADGGGRTEGVARTFEVSLSSLSSALPLAPFACHPRRSLMPAF